MDAHFRDSSIPYVTSLRDSIIIARISLPDDQSYEDLSNLHLLCRPAYL
jgi:hypothetical protein